MPLQRFRFEVAGDVQYSRAFAAAAEEVRDLRTPLAMIGKMITSSVHEQFRTQGSHSVAGGWKPLDPAYAAWKAQQVGEQPILVFTGDMRAKMLDPDAIHVDLRRLDYNPDVPDYAEKHQTGTENAGGHLPQRQMVAVTEVERREWDHIFARWLNDKRYGPLAVLPS